MSALGQKQTCAPQKVMSALPPKADMCGATRDVRFGPIADIATSRAPRRKLSKVVNFEQKILHPLVSVGSSYTPCGRSRCARIDPHIVHEDFAEPNVALRSRGRGRSPRKHVHSQ